MKKYEMKKNQNTKEIKFDAKITSLKTSLMNVTVEKVLNESVQYQTTELK